MGAVNSIVTGIKNYSKKDGNKNIVLLAVYLIIQTSVFAMLTPFFITAANFQNLMRQTAELGMVTIPLAIILMTGNIDLSIGSVMGVCAISLARLLKTGMNIWLAVLITILIGAAIGSLNGFLVARMHLAGIVATLGTQVMLRGVCNILTGGRPAVPVLCKYPDPGYACQLYFHGGYLHDSNLHHAENQLWHTGTCHWI